MSITVKTQADLDRIPLDTEEKIYIEFGTKDSPAIIKNKYFYPVEARGNSSVVAYGNSSVVAYGNSSVKAWDNSSVKAWDNSSVEARDNSFVEARDNSSVVAWGNSSVVAWGNSSVVAYGNSTVEAWNNSTVEAKGNVQVVDRLTSGAIWLSSNARKVCMPKTIEEYLNFYDIETDGKTAILYKAVHKQEGEYVSDYDTTFKYIIGGLITEPNCNTNVDENCGKSIHVSHLNWALDYGRGWSDLAILALEVEIKDIIMPINSDGKVRVPKAKVIREVPLSECGLYGKILERKIKGS